TNGTKAIYRAAAADKLIIGSFLNLTAVCNYLQRQNKDVLLLCAGWRDRYNLEDSLFAGAVVEILEKNPVFAGMSDSAIAAKHLYLTAKNDLNAFLKVSSHRKRLARLDLERDIEYCLQIDTTEVVPEFMGNGLYEHSALNERVI